MENGNKPITPFQYEGYPSHYSVLSPDALVGLTKREYFAAMAVQGLCSWAPTLTNDAIAQRSLSMADALLKELETNNNK